MISPIGAFLVVDEAELRAQARVVERGGADEADLLLPREHELDARVRDVLGEHAAHALEHLRDGRFVVSAEDRAAGIPHDAVLDDRPQLAARRDGVEMGAEEERRPVGRSARSARRRCRTRPRRGLETSPRM